jgi:hypothetical protein
MDLFEELVMQYVTKDGSTFVSPQFPVGKGWSAPDFVALDFSRKRVSVIEVTTAYDPTKLANKVADREQQWFAKLRTQLEQKRIVDGSWSYWVQVFIRRDGRTCFEQKVGKPADVLVHALEDMGFPWQWNWSEN